MRLAVYGAASTAVAASVILSAFNQRANFYSACVYLAQSNACLMVLTNLLILVSLFVGHGLQRLFYGPLRAMEVEQIYEKAWYAVTETCLAMTIFRDEFDIRFIVMFGVLLFVKCFSWIGGGRVEFMEQQPPERPVLFHIRLASSLVLLCASCAAMVWHSVSAVLERGKPNMMVMFAFEFAILTITSTGILARYVLGLIEKWVLHKEAKRRHAIRVTEREAARRERENRHQEMERRRAAGETVEDVPEEDEDEDEDEEVDLGSWEDKGTYVFYCEIFTDFLKLLTYLSFFSIVLTWYGLPLHIIRDVYLTLRSFITRIRDFVRYRRATAHMNSRYPDASPEEVEREGVCIICREEMRPWAEGDANGGGVGAGRQDQRHRAKKLPCGHVLHFGCLRSWLERQQRCPTCRRAVLDDPAPTTNGNQPNNQAGNGIAFQAQFGIGPLGFDIGVGGPGMMQNWLNRMNQQNQENRQPGDQGQRPANQPAQVNTQQGNLNQGQQAGPVLQEQRNLAMGAAPQPDAGMQGVAQPNTPTDIQQQILRTQQLIQRMTMLLPVTQQQLFQLQQLQAQAQGAANSAAATTAPAVDSSTSASTSTPQSSAEPATASPAATNLQTPLSPSRSAGPSVPSHSAATNLPSGLTLPPGWSVIPLTLTGTAPSSSTSVPPFRPLASRRSHRSYQETLRNYHALRTPSERPREEAELGSSSWPGIHRSSVSAPSARSPSRSRDSSNRFLTQDQRTRLSPILRFVVTRIASHVAQQCSDGSVEAAAITLRGLPEELRREILAGWPDRVEASGLESRASALSDDSADSSARAIASLLTSFRPADREYFLLGLPQSFRATVFSHLPSSSAPNTTSSPSATSEVPPLDPGATSEDIYRVDEETRALVDARIRALNDASRAMRDAAASLERAGMSPGLAGTERLNLFGGNSIFGQNAQERAVRDLEKEREEEGKGEKERREQVEALLGRLEGASSGEGLRGDKGKGKEKAVEGGA